VQLRVKGRGVEVSDALRAYAEKRLRKLDRQLKDPEIELELSEEHNPSIRDRHIAEATVTGRGPVLRARESSHDMRASIDRLVDKLERQAARFRGKRDDRRHGRRARTPEEPA
jgi:putative sigma-54 modulation protein